MRTTITAASLAFALAACSTPKPEPELASSAAQGNYAASYPDAVQESAKRFTLDEANAKTIDGKMSGYPEELKDVDATHALAIYRASSDAGRSRAFVERIHASEGASAFFDAQKDEISRKVAASAQYVAKQKGCDVDVGGAVAHALKESVDKQLEKSLREKNEGQALIERWRASLGKDNAATLERQSDELASASYLVHVAMVEEKLRLRAMLEDAEQVKKTADEYIAAEHAFQAEGGRTDADKKASNDRIDAMNKSKAQIDAAMTQAKSVADGLEPRIEAAQKAFADAFAALTKKLEDRGAKKP